MNTRTKIVAVTRENDTAGKFQVDLTPVETISGKELAERLADYSHHNAAQAQATLTMLEGFVLAELAKGKKIDFELVSFYPRLSGALPSRDSSPEAEGLFVRGAVKARRALMNGLKDKLEAVNNLSSVHSRIFNVFDKTLNRFDIIATGHTLSVSGFDMPVDAAKADEGAWLERRTHDSYVQVAKGRIVSSAPDILELVFDDPIAAGKYMLAVYTRCGHGDKYRVVRIGRKIRAVG